MPTTARSAAFLLGKREDRSDRRRDGLADILLNLRFMNTSAGTAARSPPSSTQSRPTRRPGRELPALHPGRHSEELHGYQ